MLRELPWKLYTQCAEPRKCLFVNKKEKSEFIKLVKIQSKSLNHEKKLCHRKIRKTRDPPTPTKSIKLET